MSTEERDKLHEAAWANSQQPQRYKDFLAGWDAHTRTTPNQEEIAEAISVELAKRTNWEDSDSAGLTPGTDLRLAAAILALFNEKGNE